MIKRIYRKLVYITSRDRVNLIQTVILNFLMLPIKDALKFPVLIYGRCKIADLSGKIIFNCPLHRGVLKIGICDPIRSYYSKSYISIVGVIELGDNVVLRRGVNLSVKKRALLRLDDDVYIGDNCTIISVDNITIEKATRVGNNTTFMDTDFHSIINVKTRQVKQNHSSILIGENNWIGGWCTIKKGTKTPKGTIIAGPYSMTCKSYMDIIPQCSIIAGSPAKLLVEGMRRVNNSNSDKMIIAHFSSNNEVFKLPDDIDIDSFCLPN